MGYRDLGGPSKGIPAGYNTIKFINNREMLWNNFQKYQSTLPIPHTHFFSLFFLLIQEAFDISVIIGLVMASREHCRHKVKVGDKWKTMMLKPSLRWGMIRSVKSINKVRSRVGQWDTISFRGTAMFLGRGE